MNWPISRSMTGKRSSHAQQRVFLASWHARLWRIAGGSWSGQRCISLPTIIGSSSMNYCGCISSILNVEQIAEVNQQLLALASKGDGYLKFRRNRRPPLPVTIDFDRSIDRFFWDTDFLELTVVYEQPDPRAKQSLGANPETLAVIQGGSPPRRAAPIPPLPPREGRVRTKQSQGKRLRFPDCHTLL